MFDVKLSEMKSALTTQIAEESDIAEVIETVKHRMRDANLPDIEVVRILWDVIMDAVQWSGKNQQQNANSALRQVILLTLAYIPLFCVRVMNELFLLSFLPLLFWSIEHRKYKKSTKDNYSLPPATTNPPRIDSLKWYSLLKIIILLFMAKSPVL